ncbi:unnamed protein product [Jaminaea pallidilutea]
MAEARPSTSDLHATPLRPEPTRKKAPGSGPQSRHGFRLQYSPSPSGVDSNLIVFLHGLGDTSEPFFKLGRQFQQTIPQTAVLSVQGTKRIPILPEEAWCYWDVIDQLGGPVSSENPSKFLEAFQSLLEELTTTCGWPAEAIHLFGFAHGATAALEGAIAWTRQRRQSPDSRAGPASDRLGSVVSVCGELLSLPTFSPPLATPLLHYHRHPPTSSQSKSTLASLQRGFANVQEVRQGAVSPQAGPVGMPQSKSEWDPIVVFWSKVVRNRSHWETSGEVYSVQG